MPKRHVRCLFVLEEGCFRRMQRPDPARALSALITEASDRLAKRWAREALSEVSNGAMTGRRELKKPLEGHLTELARHLAQRGPSGVALWAESVRHHGGERYEQQYSISDLIREFHALFRALTEEWQRKWGAPPAEVMQLCSDACAQGAASAADDYVRRMRAGRAHLREAAAIDTIVRHVDEGLLAVEGDGTLSYATPPASRILGIDEAELVGLPSSQVGKLIQRLDLRDESGRPLEPGEIPYLEVLTTGRPTRSRWLRLRRPTDHAERVVRADAVAIVENGELRGVVQAIRDRTDEYQQREALAGAYEELRVLHLVLLRRARAAAIGDVARGIAGTLNNAMNAIRLRTTVLTGQGIPSEHLAAIEGSVEEVARLVQRLQESALPRGTAPLELVPIDDVVREALEIVRPELVAAAAGRTLYVSRDLGASASVRARRGDVREIVVHFLLSAIDEAPPDGTVRIMTSVEHEAVRLCLSHPAPTLPRETLTPASDLAAEWGASVSVRASSDGGTELCFDFPVPAEAPAGAPAAVTSPPEIPGPPPGVGPARAVLIVDDDKDNRQVLAELLAARGFDVADAGTAAAAEALAASRPYDAALVDLAMPDKSGWDIVRTLHLLRPAMRIALVTGYEAKAEPGRDVPHVEGVFRKPVDLARLLAFLGEEPGERALSP
ncbi:MAG: response regulator [Deltaproteobacteria bacterium]|nr:response regulator [Deltaproteobacteria bacterium]